MFTQEGDNNKIQWDYLFLINKTEGINSSGVKAKVYRNTNYYWEEWLIPWGFSIEQSTIRSSQFEKSNFREASINIFSIGRTGIKSIKENLYLNITVNATIGNEKLTGFDNRSESNFLIGVSPRQSLMYVPKSNFGYVIEVGLYETLLNSKIYSFDMGIQIGVGLNF